MKAKLIGLGNRPFPSREAPYASKASYLARGGEREKCAFFEEGRGSHCSSYGGLGSTYKARVRHGKTWA